MGPNRADLLKSELGIYTFGDLMNFFPNRYIDRSQFFKIVQLQQNNAEIQIISIPKEEYSEELRYFEKMDGIAEIILEESRLITRLFHNADQIFNKNK